MSGGAACTCKPRSRAGWYVLQYRCNYSAFNGYRYTPSDYSCIKCVTCNSVWRTNAAYVDSLQIGPNAIKETST